jgi:hypothetical protein
MQKAKKIVFDDDGEIKEEVEVAQQPETVAELKPKTKKNRVEKRDNLRKKLMKREQEYFAKKFKKEAINEPEEENSVVEKSTANEDESVEETKESLARKLALQYLETFIVDKATWKFQKVRQTWILRNLYYQHQIDNDHFKQCLQYMANMGDRAKTETVQEAKQMLENQSEEITDTIRKRAKKIIKAL